jgi:Zn-dependent protease with chaperone function
MVDELAVQARTRPPDEITLVPEINAAVSEDTRVLGMLPGRRYMVIGLPLLAGLNLAELRSVLMHELGHYGGGHTRLRAVSYRGAETLARTVSRLDPGPARWFLTGYAWLYAVLSRSANRAQELQADAYSVDVVGKATAISALRKIATMGLFWDSFAQRFLALPGMAQRTPDILLGFRSFLAHPQQQQIVAEIEQRVLDTEPSSLFDTHPTIRRRIAAIEALPDKATQADRSPAWTVLTNAGQVIPAAEAELYITRELGPHTSWEEIVQLAGAADAARGAELLAKAAHDSGAAPSGTLGEILQALESGEAQRIVSPLLPGALSAERMREVLTELLADVIVSALITQGRAHHELNWGGAWRLIGPDGELKVAELVRPAVRNPALVPAFVQDMTAMGVPMDFVRWPSAKPAPQRDTKDGPELVAVAPLVEAFWRSWDVFVYGHGLLLIRVKFGQLFVQHLGGAIGQAGQLQRKRITRLLELESDKLFGRPKAKWLSMKKMIGGNRKSFFNGGGKIVLRMADGGSVELRTASDGSYKALTDFLDAIPSAPAGGDSPAPAQLATRS